MEIVRGLHNFKPRHRGCVLTVGNFDGVHRGHQLLLSHLIAKGQQLGVSTTLMTLEPAPREFFAGETVPARLTRFREKVTLLEPSGLDRIVCLPFNERIANTPAEWIVEELMHKLLAIKYVVVGDDFRFGKGAAGDYHMLEESGAEFGFEAAHIGTLEVDGERVSSTRIRECLADGDFALTERLLGHPYFIMGRVVYGRQLGRTLGAPTANIQLQRYRAALNGVYAVKVNGLDRTYEGVANIGIRPTVDGKEPLLEVHIFDFDRDIYGALISVEFRHKIRDERQFDGLDALKAQIHYDFETARAWFADG
ncbi:MAG: bifunctional riboflavin kinase/FAD synthetase [Gammaproteobacteria bacterium]|nr:bifunctional riboflavin kinase/FAD synthetase [Gammaproteobacteria bacterium]